MLVGDVKSLEHVKKIAQRFCTIYTSLGAGDALGDREETMRSRRYVLRHA